MGVRFACHACRKRLNVKSELAGRRGICPACSVRFRIPEHDTQTSTPVDASDAAEMEASPVTAKPSAVESERSAASPRGDMAVPLASHPSEILGGATATWYVRPTSGGQFGPADGPTLNQWILEGRVADTAMLWRDGWPEWRSARGFLPSFKDAEPQRTEQATGPVAKPQPQPAAKPIARATQPASDAPNSAPSSKPGALRNTGPANNTDAREAEVAASRSSSTMVDPDAPLRTSGKVLGTNKKRLSRKRVTMSVMLGLVFIVLLGLLVFVLMRN